MGSSIVSNQVLILFRPVYTDSGSSTELLFADSLAVYDIRSVDSIRAALAREYAVDLQAQARKIARDLHRYPPLPFYLPDPNRPEGGRVFIPLKMRTSRVARDRVYGYVDLHYIERLEPALNHCLLNLTSGHSIELPCSLGTARGSLAVGREIADRYLRTSSCEEEQIIQAARLLLGRLNRIEDYLNRLTR